MVKLSPEIYGTDVYRCILYEYRIFHPSVEESGVESNRRLINYNVDIYIYMERER